jgi:predicted house-cleaning noncanonical NTP pyrophosphatase (MazG superfamily)
MEVIFAAAEARGYTRSQLEEVRARKAAERGGFTQKLLLKEVFEK